MARQSTFHVRSGVWLLPHKRHSSGGHPCHPRIQVAMCDVPFVGLPGIGSTPGRWWIPRLRLMPPTHTTSQLGPRGTRRIRAAEDPSCLKVWLLSAAAPQTPPLPCTAPGTLDGHVVCVPCHSAWRLRQPPRSRPRTHDAHSRTQGSLCEPKHFSSLVESHEHNS